MQHLFDLKGKTALVTGASSGLGWRFAEVLSQAGATVIVTARRLDRLEALAKEITAKGLQARAVMMDVDCQDAVRETISSLEQRGERIDILVNNAGIGIKTPIFEPDQPDDFENVIQTNLIGVWHVTKHTANHMKKNNIEGSIINIASVSGSNKTAKKTTSYCAAKAGVIQLTKALVGELAAEKIRINCILPGLFYTPMTDYKLKDPESRKDLEKAIPLGFVAKPEDLDGTLLLLASNKASRYITGSHFTVDGGVSWQWHSVNLRSML